MITAMRPYSGVPSSNITPVVFTVTDTVALSSNGSGATGAEFANSRLGNFLSDDPAPKDRDLDSLFSSDSLAAYDSASATPCVHPMGEVSTTFAAVSYPPARAGEDDISVTELKIFLKWREHNLCDRKKIHEPCHRRPWGLPHVAGPYAGCRSVA